MRSISIKRFLRIKTTNKRGNRPVVSGGSRSNDAVTSSNYSEYETDLMLSNDEPTELFEVPSHADIVADSKQTKSEIRSAEAKVSRSGTLDVPNPQDVVTYQNPKEDGKDIKYLDRSKDSLFPHPPSPGDIRQGGIGDCYFLSVINSILAKPNGPEIIQNMMREENGKVYVRFYNKNGLPEIICVDKKIPADPLKHNKSSGFFNQAPLWISILEKAYICYQLGSDYKNFINGGHSESVFPYLLGERSNTKSVRSEDENELKALFLFGEFSLSNKNNIGLSRDELELWKLIWNRNSLQKEYLDRGINTMRDVDLDYLLNKAQTNTNEEEMVIQKIKDWVNNNNVLPGKRGTGKYSTEQLELYEQMKELTQDGFCITAMSDPNVVSGGKQTARDNTGEGIAKGMAGEHVYAVMRCEERNGLAGVVVRNPWGKYGREYSQNKDGTLSAKSTKQGEFWMEFGDFTKRMLSISFCGNYLYKLEGSAEGQRVDKVPVYVLAANGLFYMTVKGEIERDRLITDDPAKIEYLMNHINTNGYERITSTQRDIISHCVYGNACEEDLDVLIDPDQDCLFEEEAGPVTLRDKLNVLRQDPSEEQLIESDLEPSQIDVSPS